MKKSLLTLFLIVFLAACSSNTSAPESTKTAAPTITNAPTEMSGAFEPFPTQPTPVRLPTNTLYFTRTPEVITPFPTITQPPQVTPIGNFVSASPSKEWAAWEVNCQSFYHVFGCLKFTNENGQTWTFDDFDFDLWRELDYRMKIDLARWSVDEESVYISLGIMDMPGIVAMVQFSLVDGSFSYIVTPIENGDPLEVYELYRYGFSENGKWLAYLWQGNKSLEIRLRNLDNGVVKEYSVDDLRKEFVFGDVSWSPNNQYFVFSVSESDLYLYSDLSDDFSVFQLRVRDGSIERIYAHGDLYLYDPEWVSVSEVKYKYMDLDTHSGEVVFDTKTGEMTILY